MLTATHSDGPAFNTRKPQLTKLRHNRHSNTFYRAHNNPKNHYPQIDLKPYYKCKERDPFCKRVSKRPTQMARHRTTNSIPSTHVKGLLYKHITDASKKFLALVIPKSWKYTVLVEAHDKLGHQGNSRTYCLIKTPVLLERQ